MGNPLSPQRERRQSLFLGDHGAPGQQLLQPALSFTADPGGQTVRWGKVTPL